MCREKGISDTGTKKVLKQWLSQHEELSNIFCYPTENVNHDKEDSTLNLSLDLDITDSDSAIDFLVDVDNNLNLEDLDHVDVDNNFKLEDLDSVVDNNFDLEDLDSAYDHPYHPFLV